MGHRLLGCVIAAAAFAGSTTYVVFHPKSDAAPLQPPIASTAAKASPAPEGKTPAPKAMPRITLQPGVHATDLPGVTYTHVS